MSQTRHVTDMLSSSFVDAGSPAEQGDDSGHQPNAGGAEPRLAAQTGAQEGAAHQALQLSAGELRVLSASQVHPRYSSNDISFSNDTS